MRKTTLKNTLSIVAFIFSLCISAQTSTCYFEEQNGLLTIEMDSGNLPAGTHWKMGSEPDLELAGSTINYIYWDVPDEDQTFNALAGAPITYNIKINNPGTYRLLWRGHIGKGTATGEHNDAWLKIVADDFYATKQNSPTSTPVVEPKPDCNSNPNRNCPVGSSVDGFFKAFMNRNPEDDDVTRRWGFVTNTNDGDSFRFIWATFNTAGNYSVIVDARSSWFLMDKMVLYRTTVSNATATNLNNSESSCFNALSAEEFSKINNIKVSPNPTTNTIKISNLPVIGGTISITNTYGVTVKKVKYSSSNKTIDISELSSGIYFITSMESGSKFVKKIIKI